MLDYFKDREGVEEIYNFYVDLGAGGVSSDEEDLELSQKNGVSTYVIRPRKDVAKIVGDLGKAIDDAYEKFLKPKYEGATPVHYRVPGSASTTDHAPLYHLPRNAYLDDWLDDLGEVEKENLGATLSFDFAKALARIRALQ